MCLDTQIIEPPHALAPSSCASGLPPLWDQPVFKIEVFNALQTLCGPSKCTSLKTTLQNATPN